jgi:hypothetical protein
MALSFMSMLSPAEAAALLDRRSVALEAQLTTAGPHERGD